MRSVARKFARLVVLLAAAGFAFPVLAQTEDALMSSMKKAGQVKVALGSVAPLVSVSPDGKANGYFVELTDLVLKRLDLPPLTPILMAWNAQAPALQARQVDIVGVASITEERCKAIAISAPVFINRDALYVLPANPKQVTSVAQIARSPEIRLAVVTGSTQEAYAKGQGIKPEQLVRVADVQAGAATVIGGRADAFQIGQFSIISPEQKGLKEVADEQLPYKGVGLAFRKEDLRFRDAFNQQLNELRSNGEMKELYAVKYGFNSWDKLASLAKADDLDPRCR